MISFLNSDIGGYTVNYLIAKYIYIYIYIYMIFFFIQFGNVKSADGCLASYSRNM